MSAAASGAGLPSKHICVVHLSGIGDVVHGLPIVNALKRDDPERRIVWIVESAGAPLLKPHPAVDEVLTFDRRRGIPEVMRLWRTLHPKRFDLVLNFVIYFKGVFPTVIARAPHRICFGRDRAREPIWLFANHRLPPTDTPHTQDRYIEFLAYLGIDAEPLEWRILLSAEERKAQRAFFSALDDGPVVGIIPTSGRTRKDCEPELFARVATALARDFGCHVVLVGGAAERERARAREVMARAEAEPIWALSEDLRKLVFIVEACDFIIAPDTGPLHIARALNTPVIGIYAATDPDRYGPYRAYQDLVIDRYHYDAPGVPADDPRPLGREGRMRYVSVGDVLEKAELALKRYVKRSQQSEAEA